MSPDTALIACRFLHGESLMLLWGSSAYLAWLVPGELAGMVAQRLLGAGGVAIAIAVATSLVALPIETAQIGNGWGDALDADTVGAVLFETTVGWAWQVQTALTLLIPIIIVLLGPLRLKSLAKAAGPALASLALSGHALMQDGMVGVVHIANDALHVLSGGAWLGALVPLLVILLRLRDPLLRREVGAALQRFSSAGHFAVALVILTGIANMALILGRLPTDWSSPYQALLTIKIVVVAVMTLLAILNRYILVPRLSRHSAIALGTICRVTVAEVLLGLLAMACVAFFGTFEPT